MTSWPRLPSRETSWRPIWPVAPMTVIFFRWRGHRRAASLVSEAVGLDVQRGQPGIVRDIAAVSGHALNAASWAPLRAPRKKTPGGV